MTKCLTYQISQLPGEQFQKTYLNETELQFQIEYRKYQDYRMNVGQPMADIDCKVSTQMGESFNAMLNSEYNQINGKCINYAMLEMKHWRTADETIAQVIQNSTPAKEWCNECQQPKPFFVVKYFPADENNGNWEFTVYPANAMALKYVKYESGQHMSDQEYVKFIWGTLRNRTVPDSILQKHSNIKNMKNYRGL